MLHSRRTHGRADVCGSSQPAETRAASATIWPAS